MLLVIFALAAVGVARLVVWSTAPGTRRFTLGMLAIATANLLFVAWIGEGWIDPHLTLFGANLSDLAQHLLTAGACYQFGAATIENRPNAKLYMPYWQTFAFTIVVAMVLTYQFGDYYRTEAEEFEHTDRLSLAHDWLIVIAIVGTFTLVTISAIRDLRVAGPKLRGSVLAMLALGIVGVVCGTATGVLLTVKPDYIHAHYNQFATVGTIPALAALTIAGVPGFLAAWSRRDDPRP